MEPTITLKKDVSALEIVRKKNASGPFGAPAPISKGSRLESVERVSMSAHFECASKIDSFLYFARTWVLSQATPFSSDRKRTENLTGFLAQSQRIVMASVDETPRVSGVY